jgi:hypothetical protein
MLGLRAGRILDGERCSASRSYVPVAKRSDDLRASTMKSLRRDGAWIAVRSSRAVLQGAQIVGSSARSAEIPSAE